MVSLRAKDMRTEYTHPIRNTKYSKPQEEWKEIIAVYLYLAGMGAGSFIIGTLIGWFNVKLDAPFLSSVHLFGYTLNLSRVPILWGPVMVAVGAPFLILDLGIKRRFIYACLNPRTSWVARGFLILSIFIVVGLVVLARSALPFEWLHSRPVLWRIPEIIAFIFAFATAIYTGILLKATKSIPLWNTSILPALFLASGLSTGSMAIILSTLGTGLISHGTGALKVLTGGEQVFVVIEGILLYLFLFRRYRAAEQGKDSVRLLVFGEMKMMFWGGVVLLGFFFPVILENMASFFPGNVALICVAGIFLLWGGFFLRLGVLRAGIRDQIPMHRLMEIQYNTMVERTKELGAGKPTNLSLGS